MIPSTLTYPILTAVATVLLPFVGFLLSALAGKRAKSGVISITTIALAVIAAGYTFAQVWDSDPIHAQWHWFTIGEQVFHVGILLDNMSVLMLLLVTVVALPVHIYSVAYMQGDSGIHRYWTYLSLFCAAMLGLVIADNLLFMYICWELVGFASYLLIGFWFTKDAAVQANKRAFIINRIGDIGFLIGFALLYSGFGTLDITALFGEQGLFSTAVGVDRPGTIAQGGLPAGWLTAAGLAFFLGAMAKSAQFPLHVWLPAAMEGPTAVSSLIHAATMVAAGVFLLARIFPLFDETVLLVIAATGTVTALVAAYFALTQFDIKKILAFSTVSQLGFMVVAIGIGMYPIALFHLATHAFFKCLLFLCAGAVIHEMQHLNEKHRLGIDPQDIRQMGGLRRYMPVTFITMGIASLALVGFPLTSGYLSKDALLVHAFEWAADRQGAAHFVPYVLAFVSVLTSFYIFRLLAKVFFGAAATEPLASGQAKLHDPSLWMVVPMVLLALCSLFPLFSFHPLNDGHVWLLQGITVSKPWASLPLLHLAVPTGSAFATLAVAFLAWRWYVKGTYALKTNGLLHRLSFHQGYLDGLYDRFVVGAVLAFARALRWVDTNVVDGLVHGFTTLGRNLAAVAGWVDQRIVDGLVRFVGKLAWGLGTVVRRTQTGRLQGYFSGLFLVILVILLYHMIVQA
ncbi:NADH-quinone oxidoreductase subunit L [Parapedobacter sp. 10938]|uniref:NADH-quinone oxidoreductase subunit L n=1 Tax=Parapedobacter flavus TaxID=3110225 RepID=UPI002DB8ABC0|nr:NADH-quinone oxidoreductase subunit L [Parapedobacter sp. 10938]MEC3878995.1 NADH-quinone oxidoreductase subunit L [Parapedobacter sp. 10938]